MRDMKKKSYEEKNVKLNFVLPQHVYILLLLILRLLHKFGGLHA